MLQHGLEKGSCIKKIEEEKNQPEFLNLEDPISEYNIFDFKDENQVLSFEHIVRANFANPKRMTYPCVRYASCIRLSSDYDTPESIF